MKTPLIPISIGSIYKHNGQPVNLPKRLALASPDMADAIDGISKQLTVEGGRLILSDLYRSYEMQLQSHLDYKNGRKSAYSPAPVGSFHESGRGMDISLGDIKVPLKKFWQLAAQYNVVPIIAKPISSESEAWHFECRGSHQKVIDYYAAKLADNFAKPYAAGAVSAVLATGAHVDRFANNQKEAQIQAALVRLDKQIGNIDGQLGAKTRKALNALNLSGGTVDDILAAVEDLVQLAYPAEYRTTRLVASVSNGEFDWEQAQFA